MCKNCQLIVASTDTESRCPIEKAGIVNDLKLRGLYFARVGSPGEFQVVMQAKTGGQG